MTKSIANGRKEAQELSVAVKQLSEEVRVLRQAVDELRDDVVWAARQVLAAGYEVTGKPPPRPIDPLAPDGDCQTGQLSTQDATPEDLLYCCESPRLTWHGAPDVPGIACSNCGYAVAEEGNILIWRDDESADDPSFGESESPIEQQGHLFE